MKRILVLAFLLGIAGAGNAVSPTAAWHLSSDGTAYLGGSTYNMVNVGTPAYASAGGYPGLNAANSSNYVQGSSAFNSLVNSNLTSWQLEIHYYDTSYTGVQALFGWANASAVIYPYSTGYLYAQFHGTPYAVVDSTMAPSPAVNTWYSLIYTYDGAKVYSYLNGVLKDTENVAATVAPTPGVQVGYIGGYGAGANVYIRDIVFYAGNNCAGTGTCADYSGGTTPTNTPTITPSFTPSPVYSFTSTPTPKLTYTPAPYNAAVMPKPFAGFNCMTFTTSFAEGMIDTMVSDGWVASGFNYIHFDTGDFQSTLDGSGNLQYPAGFNMQTVATYAHARGVSVSAYFDVGSLGCPWNGNSTAGGYQHEQPQANQAASIGVDNMSLDLCGTVSDPNYNIANQLRLWSYCIAHPTPSRAMSWSLWGPIGYVGTDWQTSNPNAWMLDTGPTSYMDIIANFYDGINHGSVAGPGKGWGIPEWLWDQTGYPGFTDAQRQVQFDSWAMVHSVELVSLAVQDLSALTTPQKQILQNPYVLSVIDQDPAGNPCYQDGSDGTTYIGIFYTSLTNSAYAVEFLDEVTYTASAATATVHFSNIPGLPTSNVNVYDVHAQTNLGQYSGAFSSYVSASANTLYLFNYMTPGPTSTYTGTATPTATPSATPTASPTASGTRTATPTPTATASPTPVCTIIGVTTPGLTPYPVDYKMLLKSITTSNTLWCNNVNVYILSGTGKVAACVYNSSSPAQLLRNSGWMTVSGPGLISVPVSTIPLSPGTYWLGILASAGIKIASSGTGPADYYYPDHYGQFLNNVVPIQSATTYSFSVQANFCHH